MKNEVHDEDGPRRFMAAASKLRPDQAQLLDALRG